MIKYARELIKILKNICVSLIILFRKYRVTITKFAQNNRIKLKLEIKK